MLYTRWERQKGNCHGVETVCERVALMKRYILTGTPVQEKRRFLRREKSPLKKLSFEQIHEETYLSLGYDLIKIAPEALSQRVLRIMEWAR
jgi:hypothetical protein